MQLSFKEHFQPIVSQKLSRLKTGEVLYEKAYMSPRPPPKISLRHDWTKELGSKVDRQPQEEVARQPREEVAQQPRGEVSRQAKFFQPTQPIPKPICDRSGQPDNKHEVFVDTGETSWSREIVEIFSRSTQFFRSIMATGITHSVIRAQQICLEKSVEQNHDRSGQPDKHEIELRAAPEVHREMTTLNTDNEFTRAINEEDIDFKFPGLPHSTVKQLQSASVRELIQKIENHPHRHALQRDLQQSQSFNPFSQESKQMIHEVGNIELCELLDMEPKTQCKVC